MTTESAVVVTMEASLFELSEKRRELLSQGKGDSAEAVKLWEELTLISATLGSELAGRAALEAEYRARAA